MAGFNKVILVGNLTRDPELRYTPKGMAIAKLGLAVSRTWRNENGESKEEVTFVDIDSFGKQAETIGQYLKKGRRVLVEGRLRLDQWDDKQTGQKRSKLGVVLESFQFLDSSRSNESGAAEPPASRTAAPAPSNAPPPPGPTEAPETEPPQEDDVPF